MSGDMNIKALADTIRDVISQYASLEGVEIYISLDQNTGDRALHVVVPIKEVEHIIFADGQCPKCGSMTHNYGGSNMRCPDCGWVEQESGNDPANQKHKKGETQ